jgi:Zn-dependent protease with chaperone function
MAIDWQDVVYRGDAADVKELFETYRVEDYLAAFEDQQRQQDRGMRERLLKDGIRLTDRLSPRIYRIFSELCTALEIQAQPEIFCLPNPEINAFAMLDVQEKGTYSLVGITSGALEKLDDAELKSILGHEMGHFLYGNNRLNALLSQNQNNPSLTVLPSLGESLFLRWRKKAEVSGDRVGLLASRDFHASAISLMKATFGLSEKNLNLDIEALLSQVDEIKGHPEMMEETFASHPVLPIRLKALELFSRSEKAKRHGYPTTGKLIDDDALENSVDELINLTRRYPFKREHEAVMRLVSMGGALLLAADRDISDDEVKLLIHILQAYFTDEPEREIVTDKDEIMRRIPAEVEVLQKYDNMEAKGFVLSRLSDIALADGALMDAERAVILQVAEWLGVPQKLANGMLVQAAQSVGFHTDTKLNQIADQLRKSFQTGFAGRITKAPTIAG